MPTRTLRHLLPLVLVALLASCKKDGHTPSYITITAPHVLAANGTDTINSRITDLWVYLNDEPVGVWEPGDRIPLIASGPQVIKLIAGVRKNGVIDDRIQYPYYQTFSTQVDLVPEQTVTISPAFKYFPALSIWTEDFSNAGILLEVDQANSDTLLYTIGAGTSQAHGAVWIDTERPDFLCFSSQPFTITSIQTAFLELDYSCNMQFQVGVRYLNTVGNQVDVPYITVNSTARGDGTMPWNKIYIDLGSLWTSISSSEKRFFIRTGLGDLTSGELRLDNIRFVRP